MKNDGENHECPHVDRGFSLLVPERSTVTPLSSYPKRLEGGEEREKGIA